MAVPVVSPKIPPLKGSFPLDRKGVCRQFYQNYMECAKQHAENTSTDCQFFIKEYLKCRMENNLMNPEDFLNLGFKSK